MRTLDEIRRTPVFLLTDEEIGMMDNGFQEFARKCKSRMAAEQACPGHERISTATREQTRYGNHRGECKHCGKNMSWDSGD
jgi:hypothetical protein